MKKWLSILAAFSCLLLCLTACGSGMINDSAATAPQDHGDSMEELGQDSTVPNRKVITTADYNIDVENAAEAGKALTAMAEKSGGYVESCEVDGAAEKYASASYRLRIPSDHLAEVTTALEQIGRVTRYTENAEDITDKYYDVDARRRAKEAQRDRLQELIASADNLDTLLALERELADVQGELDSLTAAQKNYDQQVAFSTLNVRLQQTDAPGGTPFGTVLTGEFRHSFAAALDVGKELLVALIWLLPYALVAGVVLAIVLPATRKKRRENKARREQMRQGMNRPMPPQPYGAPPVPPVPPVPPTPPVKSEENKAPSEPPAKA